MNVQLFVLYFIIFSFSFREDCYLICSCLCLSRKHTNDSQQSNCCWNADEFVWQSYKGEHWAGLERIRYYTKSSSHCNGKWFFNTLCASDSWWEDGKVLLVRRLEYPFPFDNVILKYCIWNKLIIKKKKKPYSKLEVRLFIL